VLTSLPGADEPSGDDEILDVPVRSELLLQLFGVYARDEEVRILRLVAEQLVADGAADEVGVEAEAVDIAFELAPHRRIVAIYRAAIASISTRAPEGSFATSNVLRAGGRSPTCFE